MKLTSIASIAFATLLGCASAHAKQINLSTWSYLGDVAMTPDGVILTTTHATEIDDDPAPAGEFNVSGNSPVFTFDMESALGLPSGSLDPDPDNGLYGTEGSLIWGDISYKAGQTLSFDWILGSNDTLFPDYAFVALNGIIMPFATASDATIASGWYNLLVSTPGKFSMTFNQDGAGTLAIGVVDVGDYISSTGILVSSVTVPEGGSLLVVFALSLGAAVLVRRRLQA